MAAWQVEWVQDSLAAEEAAHVRAREYRIAQAQPVFDEIFWGVLDDSERNRLVALCWWLKKLQ